MLVIHSKTFVCVAFIMLACSWSGICQTNKTKVIDINLIPGLGTSGIDHNMYRSYISLNFLSGYSDETSLLQISGLSGTNRTYSGGLHIAGIANLTGMNLKSMDPEEYEKTIVPFVHLRGLQLSGIANVVRGDVAGGQATLIFNVSTREMLGLQIGGISNFVGGYAYGLQLAGLVNNTIGSISGVQLALAINKTGEELAGIQLGLLNMAKNIEGPKSRLEDLRTGIQVGLFNSSSKMNGLQIGVINFAKKSQGTQVGLVNIYPRRGKEKGSKDGTAIGLINIGDFTYFSLSANESFLLNYKVSTGNVKNARILSDVENRYVTNAVSFSHQALNKRSWALGYTYEKIFFNRNPIPIISERRFWSYGVGVQYVDSRKSETDNKSSIVGDLNLKYGRRLIPKLYPLYWFAAISFKGELTENSNSISSYASNAELSDNQNLFYWPGVSIGLLIH